MSVVILGCQTSQSLPKDSVSMKPPAKKSVHKDISSITIGTQTFSVEIADNQTKRSIGLMWRESLPVGEGMFFIFGYEAFHSFWMKNTIIPLDVIWISADNKVVDKKTLEPCPPKSSCPSFTSKEKALYVLEVNAGEFQGAIGDSVEIK